MRAGAGGELAARCFAAAKCAPDVGEVEPEDVVQQEACTLQRRQPFEEEHQRNGNVVCKVAGEVVLEGFIHNGFGQPLTDVKLSPCPHRFHPIET